MIKEDIVTKKMLSLIRENKKIIKEDTNDKNSEGFSISKNDTQFGDILTSQEETFIKTVGENVSFSENSLKYYPTENDLRFTGEIPSLKITFEFRYDNPDGCYIWANNLQLTETNYQTLGKIRNAYINWKQTLLADSDIMDRLHKMFEKQ